MDNKAHTNLLSPPREMIKFVIHGIFDREAGDWLNTRVSEIWTERQSELHYHDIFKVPDWADKNCKKSCWGRGIEGVVVGRDGSRTPIVCECVVKWVNKHIDELKGKEDEVVGILTNNKETKTDGHKH